MLTSGRSARIDISAGAMRLAVAESTGVLGKTAGSIDVNRSDMTADEAREHRSRMLALAEGLGRGKQVRITSNAARNVPS